MYVVATLLIVVLDISYSHYLLLATVVYIRILINVVIGPQTTSFVLL